MIDYDDLVELSEQLEQLAQHVHTRKQNTVAVLFEDIRVDRDGVLRFVAERIPHYATIFGTKDYELVVSSVYIDAFVMGHFVAKKLEGKGEGEEV